MNKNLNSSEGINYSHGVRAPIPDSSDIEFRCSCCLGTVILIIILFAITLFFVFR